MTEAEGWTPAEASIPEACSLADRRPRPKDSGRPGVGASPVTHTPGRGRTQSGCVVTAPAQRHSKPRPTSGTPGRGPGNAETEESKAPARRSGPPRAPSQSVPRPADTGVFSTSMNTHSLKPINVK